MFSSHTDATLRTGMFSKLLHRLHSIQITVSNNVVIIVACVFSRHNYELQQRIKQLEKDKKDNEIKHEREIKQLRLENKQVVKPQKIMDERKIKSHKRQNTWKSAGVIQVDEALNSSKLLNDI